MTANTHKRCGKYSNDFDDRHLVWCQPDINSFTNRGHLLHPYPVVPFVSYSSNFFAAKNYIHTPLLFCACRSCRNSKSKQHQYDSIHFHFEAERLEFPFGLIQNKTRLTENIFSCKISHLQPMRQQTTNILFFSVLSVFKARFNGPPIDLISNVRAGYF